MAKQGMKIGLSADMRPALLGRLRMADWIEMPERDFAREIEELEKDPLFKKLHFAGVGESVIRRQKWPGGRLSGSFYEINDQLLASGESVNVEEMLGDKADVVGLIQKMGRRDFEKYFVHGDEPMTLEQIAERTKLKMEEVQRIHEFLLEMGAKAEFFMPSREQGYSRNYACLARLTLEGAEPVFEFYSAHWARGLYQVRYDLLERWKDQGKLEGPERKRLARLLKRIETVNLRQSTLFRILESVSKLQADYLRSRDEKSQRPISLRMLARRLDLAPSTVSRALSGRSVRLPWGVEVPLIRFVPGRRRVLREIIGEWLAENRQGTDAAWADQLRSEHGIRVSRRTVNAVRNELRQSPG